MAFKSIRFRSFQNLFWKHHSLGKSNHLEYLPIWFLLRCRLQANLQLHHRSNHKRCTDIFSSISPTLTRIITPNQIYTFTAWYWYDLFMNISNEIVTQFLYKCKEKLEFNCCAQKLNGSISQNPCSLGKLKSKYSLLTFKYHEDEMPTKPGHSAYFYWAFSTLFLK